MKKIKTLAAVLLLSLVMALMMTGCGESSSEPAAKGYKDGTYSGRSSDYEEDESGNGAGYGTVELEIKDNKIVSCTFKMFELDGTQKDESYGADLSKENRLKAQKAVQSAAKYAQALVSAGSLDGVDVITGATISYNEFKEAVNDALNQAAVKD